MSSVFFADDDILTLNRLRDLVDWHQLGYEIAGQALDGDSALSQILEKKPDLVILDIHMPKQNGVAVAKALQAQLPGASLLVLSNHDTFEYVRSAMKYGVEDYLLKHELTADTLSQKVREINAKRKEHHLSEERKQYFAVIAKQQYLQGLAAHGPQQSREQELMAEQPEFSAPQHILAILRLTNFSLFACFDEEAERNRLIETVGNLCENVLSTLGGGLIAPMRAGEFLLLFPFDESTPPGQASQQTQTRLSLLSSNLRRFLNLQTCCAQSGVLSTLDLLPQVYAQLRGGHQGPAREAGLDILAERELVEALEALDARRTQDLVRSLLAGGSEAMAISLLAVSRRFWHAQGVAVDGPYLRQLQSALRTTQTPGQLQEILLSHFAYLLREAERSASPACSPHIRKTLQYIHQHYAQNISLGTAAEHTGISGAHLSRQFRKETGVSFIDYLTDYRLQIARKLLQKPDAKVKEVCRQVGFFNYNYFLRVYKKKTGQTIRQSGRGRLVPGSTPEAE